MATTVTPTVLKTRYPEYTLAPDALVQDHIDGAVSVLNEANCGELFDEIVLETACDSLATVAEAEQMAIDRAVGQTTKHQRRLEMLRLQAAPIAAGYLWAP